MTVHLGEKTTLERGVDLLCCAGANMSLPAYPGGSSYYCDNVTVLQQFYNSSTTMLFLCRHQFSTRMADERLATYVWCQMFIMLSPLFVCLKKRGVVTLTRHRMVLKKYIKKYCPELL